MNILQNKLLLGVGVFVALVIGVVFYLRQGEVILEISPESEVTNGITASFSADKFRRAYSVPGTITLRPGTHRVIASAEGSTLFEGEITVVNNQTATVVVLLKKSPNQSLTESNPSTEFIESIEHYALFPHITGDYRLEALLNEERTAIAKLRLTVIHHFSVEFAEQDRQLALSSAKKWLSENGIPDQFEIEVVDE